ncbi:CBS domain-containing protein [Bacillus massilinigeriensis]|uniref:CBS domain-containing protein n=1 Tax=Bacillus massilionigeriensis TaxID=1805475 RepID=UPI00096B5F8C|nr:CBS domain-containing protein [Bacillus massilionigeriensis]
MKAKDIMVKNVIKVKENQLIQDVLDRFVEYRISGIPVVNDRNELVGYVSDGDIMKWIGKHDPVIINYFYYTTVIEDEESLEDKFKRLLNKNVMEVAKKNVITVDEDTEIEKVAEILGRRRIKKVPVVKNNVLTGIISRGDIVRSLKQLFHVD